MGPKRLKSKKSCMFNIIYHNNTGFLSLDYLLKISELSFFASIDVSFPCFIQVSVPAGNGHLDNSRAFVYLYPSFCTMLGLASISETGMGRMQWS